MVGRPEFKVTAARRLQVRLCKADGWSDERVARLLGISRTTLLKHFMRELEFGADVVRAELIGDLRRASKKGNAAAAKTLLARVDATSIKPPEEPKAPALGKKEQQRVDAQTAEQGTGFGAFVKH